jgi:excisionase family DNA binding protein
MSHETTTSTAAPAQPGDEFLSKLEIAKRLKKEPRTIDNWMKRGILPYYKLGRTVAFKWGDVMTHLDKNCRRCQSRLAA